MSHVADVQHGGKVERLVVNAATAAEAVAPVEGAAGAASDVGTLGNKAIDVANQYCEVLVVVAAFDASVSPYTTGLLHVTKVVISDLELA